MFSILRGLPALLSPLRLNLPLKQTAGIQRLKMKTQDAGAPEKASLGKKKKDNLWIIQQKDTMAKLWLGKLIKTEATPVQSQHLGPNQEKGVRREKEPGV